MRLECIFGEPTEKYFVANVDYRRKFISFIKNIFSRVGLYDEFYKKKKWKPFTFAIKFRDFEIGTDEKIRFTSPIVFKFSTGETSLFVRFYNCLIKMKEEKEGGIFLDRNFFKLREIKITKMKKIKGDKILLKTESPVIMTNPEEDARDIDKWFITPLDDLEKFNEVLNKRFYQKYKTLKKKSPLSSLELVLPSKSECAFLKIGSPITKLMIKHYGGFIKGFKGVFWLRGAPDSLQFIYDYGMGVRTGQGFGYLKLILEV